MNATTCTSQEDTAQVDQGGFLRAVARPRQASLTRITGTHMKTTSTNATPYGRKSRVPAANHPSLRLPDVPNTRVIPSPLRFPLQRQPRGNQWQSARTPAGVIPPSLTPFPDSSPPSQDFSFPHCSPPTPLPARHTSRLAVMRRRTGQQ